MSKTISLSASLEDYIEAIAHIVDEKKVARGKEIAKRVVAEDVIRRHEALKEFFVKVLAIDDSIAEESACRIEHAAPPEVIERLIHFVKFIEVCPRGGADLIKGFTEYCEKGRTKESCEECLSNTPRKPSKS
jgi:DtxR family Mn-dependent transcriptional regulator